jgi:PEGA domain
MSRVIPILACGVSLAACSMSTPSLDFLKSSPTTEVLRIESDPPGAKAQNSEGQSCQTPCELKVSAGGQFISFAFNGYQPRTVQVRADGEAGRLQPNPVYAELQPLEPPAKQQSAPKRAVKRPAAAAPAPPSAPAAAATTTASSANVDPWPNPQ